MTAKKKPTTANSITRDAPKTTLKEVLPAFAKHVPNAESIRLFYRKPKRERLEADVDKSLHELLNDRAEYVETLSGEKPTVSEVVEEVLAAGFTADREFQLWLSQKRVELPASSAAGSISLADNKDENNDELSDANFERTFDSKFLGKPANAAA